MAQALTWAALGTGFTFIMTVFGAAMVFFFRKKVNDGLQKAFLGFASGIMIAASVWSLLIPAIEQAKTSGDIPWVPAAAGFLMGGLFLFFADSLISKNIRGFNRRKLMVFAMTLHNIPEGMAVGLAFGLAASCGEQPELYATAAALALGIGIQNFPEGAAVALPLRQEGMPLKKSFLYGILSAIVEPVFGISAVLTATWIRPAMPWLLSFAAGAMIYVVVEQLIPEANDSGRSHRGVMGSMIGFMIMMILDVALSL
ncbi:ZIP family metal transporter [Frisingicoccus sp.]|uniref:ZIP family metal transporter n=1 Tax=Frisingicoccus sp. TaxID=1918627 RepID=UPI002ECDD21E|nr:ZIP family metal transporter [Frisingicoccus sp.]